MKYFYRVASWVALALPIIIICVAVFWKMSWVDIVISLASIVFMGACIFLHVYLDIKADRYVPKKRHD